MGSPYSHLACATGPSTALLHGALTSVTDGFDQLKWARAMELNGHPDAGFHTVILVPAPNDMISTTRKQRHLPPY